MNTKDFVKWTWEVLGSERKDGNRDHSDLRMADLGQTMQPLESGKGVGVDSLSQLPQRASWTPPAP